MSAQAINCDGEPLTFTPTWLDMTFLVSFDQASSSSIYTHPRHPSAQHTRGGLLSGSVAGVFQFSIKSSTSRELNWEHHTNTPTHAWEMEMCWGSRLHTTHFQGGHFAGLPSSTCVSEAISRISFLTVHWGRAFCYGAISPSGGQEAGFHILFPTVSTIKASSRLARHRDGYWNEHRKLEHICFQHKLRSHKSLYGLSHSVIN